MFTIDHRLHIGTFTESWRILESKEVTYLDLCESLQKSKVNLVENLPFSDYGSFSSTTLVSQVVE